ncbi:hypothetical protein HF086_006393 [Spodoptera exigua]|uniref:Uncharacterized protein n=1 Tax=Spodoptera exigua TaxID=7107 RepID=A0A922MVQ8_SPOEX|nr:hypothetical protein HF086_006393 [Spodoptera exigua]
MELKKIKLETLGVREHGVPVDDNFIDKDLDSMFYPLHLMQMALLSPKYILKKNFAKPNNILFKLLSIGLTAMLCFVFTYRIHNLSINEELLLNIPTMYYSAYFDLVFYSIGFDATTTFVILFNYTTWIYKMLMTQVLLSTNFEAFYRAMYKSQDICAIILNSNCTDKQNNSVTTKGNDETVKESTSDEQTKEDDSAPLKEILIAFQLHDEPAPYCGGTQPSKVQHHIISASYIYSSRVKTIVIPTLLDRSAPVATQVGYIPRVLPCAIGTITVQHWMSQQTPSNREC